MGKEINLNKESLKVLSNALEQVKFNHYDDLFEGLPKPIKARTCSVCGHEGPDEDFHIGTPSTRGKKTARMAKCKTCHTSRQNRSRKAKKNIESPKADYRCVICNRSAEEFRPVGKWCADHCDKSGIFRGWLCQPCNLGLGNFEDDPLRLITAAKYLIDFEERKDPVFFDQKI